MKIGITGARGLVGSRIADILHKKYEILGISSNDLDIRNKSSIYDFLSDKNLDVLLHLAAKADVDGCEAEKDEGKDSEAWDINVNGARNVADFCSDNNIKLIHISTDFVFDGNKDINESYTENDMPNPINFYGVTKLESEKVIQSIMNDYVILRIAYPYRKEFEQKKDFVRAILGKLQEGIAISAVTDHIMCPTFIDDIANYIDHLIGSNSTGVYHCVGSSALSPYEAANEIADIFGLDKKLIQKTTRDEYFQGKAKRPFNLNLKSVKIEDLKIQMTPFRAGLEKIKTI